MNKLIPILLILFISACTVPQKITVSNLHDLARYPENCKIYSLPQTRMLVTVKVVRHQTVSGPYCSFASDLLGINGAPKLSQTSWEIIDVKLRDIIQADPDYYFSIQSSNPSFDNKCLSQMLDKGMLLNPGRQDTYLELKNVESDQPEPIHYMNLSISGNIENPSSSDLTITSAVPVDLPIVKQSFGDKNTLEKAQEAAKFIFKIRKRRFKLMAGQYEVYPEGEALETAIQEMTKLEAEYLKLFVGKVYTDTIERQYHYTPKVGEQPERAILCRFSEETGFAEASSTTGKPLVLDIQKGEQTKILKDIQLSQSGPSYEGFALYRIPERALTKVISGSKVLLEAEIKVYQYGAFVPYSLVEK